MQRNHSLWFRPRREKFGDKIKVSTVTNFIITLVLMTGCLCQITSIFKLYLKYPTNIFIETKFKSYCNSFPAITYCTNIGEQSGQSTDDTFWKNYLNKIIQNFFILSPDHQIVTHLYHKISETRYSQIYA